MLKLRRLFTPFMMYVAPDSPGATVPAFTVKKKVTLPLLSMKPLDIVHVRFDSAAKLGKKLKGDDSKKEPAHLSMVTDLTTGEEMQMIMPAVLRSTLEEEYPRPSQEAEYAYVGKCFQITSLGKKQGKTAGTEGYNTFKIVEIELTRTSPADAAKAKK